MYSGIKRSIDIIGSLFGLVILTPFLLVLILLVRMNLGYPVFFKQKRPGLNEKPFLLIKFRSMRELYDNEGNLLPDKERLTKFGKFLRSSSLDELPELWNVLKGEMSLVGPRPLYMAYLPYYTEEEKLRHTVRPGITGLAQVSGRNLLPWNKRLEYDAKYVKSLSLWLDIKILFKTFLNVVKRENVVPIPGTMFQPLNIERGEKAMLGKTISK